LELGDFITAEVRLALNFGVRIVAGRFLGRSLMVAEFFIAILYLEKAWKQRADEQHSHHEVQQQMPIRKKVEGVLGTSR
jgi:hypothetical protein